MRDICQSHLFKKYKEKTVTQKQKTKKNEFIRFHSRRKSIQKSLVRNIILLTITGEKYNITEDKRRYGSRSKQ